MDLWDILLLVLRSLIIIYSFIKYKLQYWWWNGIPHDKPTFPYKNINDFGKNTPKFIMDLYKKYKPTGAKLCGSHFCFRPIGIVLDLDLVKQVLQSDFEDFSERGLYYNEENDPYSAHLFSLHFEKWKPLRHMFKQKFTPKIIKFSFQNIIMITERFEHILYESIQQHDQLEMKDLLARFTTDVIGICAFGVDCNSLTHPNVQFRMYGKKLFEEPRHSASERRFWDEFDSIGRLMKLKKIPDDIAEFFTKTIKSTVETREMDNVKKNDFIDHLIELKNEGKITFNQLAAQSFVFFQAGFESTSSTLTFCLYELAINNKIQVEARNSIVQDTYQEYNGKQTCDLLKNMPYINQIIEETLRKYPAALYMPRRAQRDFPVPGTNTVIKNGTKILIPVQAIHHDPTYYPNPNKFDPDRFNATNKKNRHPMAWLAFGEGKRNCFGKDFGLMQIQACLVMLLKNFQINLGSQMTTGCISINEKISLLTPNYLYLKLTPLNTHADV